jgi:2,5-diketo-D-gluconate reductase B
VEPALPVTSIASHSPVAANWRSLGELKGALKVKLDDEDRSAIAALPKDQRYVKPPFAPDWTA